MKVHFAFYRYKLSNYRGSCILQAIFILHGLHGYKDENLTWPRISSFEQTTPGQ